MNNLDQLLGVIGRVGETLNEIPEAREALQKAQRGELTVDQAVAGIVKAIQESGQLEAFTQAADEAAIARPTEAGGLRSPLMEDGRGKQRLNPVLEAAIAERAALDGDVPELRSGPLPAEGRPAVPVLTQSLNPVVVGAMLESASNQVLAHMNRALEAHQAEFQALILAGEQKPALPVPTGVPGYVAGEVPALMMVTEPAPVSIPAHKAQEYAYRALSTTQGRVSLAGPIAARIQQLLEDDWGTLVSLSGEPAPAGRVSHTWTMQAWGQEDFSASFNFGEVAAKALVSALAPQLERHEEPLCLRVEPFNGIADRRFGWTAHIGPRR